MPFLSAASRGGIAFDDIFSANRGLNNSSLVVFFFEKPIRLLLGSDFLLLKVA